MYYCHEISTKKKTVQGKLKTSCKHNSNSSFAMQTHFQKLTIIIVISFGKIDVLHVCFVYKTWISIDWQINNALKWQNNSLGPSLQAPALPNVSLHAWNKKLTKRNLSEPATWVIYLFVVFYSYVFDWSWIYPVFCWILLLLAEF